jgi:hypothetical protein
MADNPRELIRAAQSAELQGDVKRAVEYLRKAAEVYRQAGNTSRALQLLRHARKLDGGNVELAEEVSRLEWMPQPLTARRGSEDDEDARLASELDRSLGEEPLPELVRRQRLIEDALREASRAAAEAEQASGEDKVWVIGTEVAEDLQRLEIQLAKVAASVDPAEVVGDGGVAALSTEAVRAVADPLEGALAAEAPAVPVAEGALPARPVRAASLEAPGPGEWRPAGRAGAASGEPLRTEALAEAEGQEGSPRQAAPLQASGQPEAVRAASLEVAAAQGQEALPGTPRQDASAEAGVEEPARPRRRREQRLIDRGPTRADVALDAWCSFCCRPRTEAGDLVAGPTGAFICKACLNESQSLLGDVVPVPLPARPRPVEAAGAVMELVGQAEARALLDAALQAGARCLLAVGPEGCGKSVWFQQLQRQGQGVFTPISALEQATSQAPLLVEDVDRLDASAHTALAAFLARNPRHTVLLSARGTGPEKSGPLLRGDMGLLPVPTTAALGQAVRGALPASVLEHVQVLLPLHAPTQPEYVEIARRRLALREPAISLSSDVLEAFAAEAVRSPRAGHELQALLNRVPAGSWRLENPAPPPRKARRKGTP